jgi:hypothetical protein
MYIYIFPLYLVGTPWVSHEMPHYILHFASVPLNALEKSLRGFWVCPLDGAFGECWVT